MCSIQEGSPPFFFAWAKNGNSIKSGPNVNYKIENSEMFSTFTIKKLERNDAANYTCTVSNSIGSDTQIVILNIKGIFSLESYFNKLIYKILDFTGFSLVKTYNY